MDAGLVALGIHDFVPVTLAAVGTALVAAAVATARPEARGAAASGAALVVLGGLAKATAKLVGALTSAPPPVLLDGALFPLLAAGMLVLAAAVLAVVGDGPLRRVVGRWQLVPVVVWGTATIAAGTVTWELAEVLLIALATIGNVALAAALVRWARQLDARLAAVLFATNLVVVLGLAGMARVLEPTTAAQWVEQNTNLGAQLAFLVASLRLRRAVRDRTGRTAEAVQHA